jgi:hypothetical protein
MKKKAKRERANLLKSLLRRGHYFFFDLEETEDVEIN